MRKLLPSLLIAIMALSVLSCAGVVSAKTATGSVHPLVIGPSTPQYYPVTAAVGNNYYFYPGQYNYYGTSTSKNPNTAVVAATANPNNGNLYTYESIRAYYGNTRATALNGVNLLINAPTTGTLATTATITVYEKAAAQVQVANPLNAWAEMGTLATYSEGGFGVYGPYYYPWQYTVSNGKLPNGVQAMTDPYVPYTMPINPGLFVNGWTTGTYQIVAGYLMSASSGTTGTVSAQGQVQAIEIQFS